MVVPLQAHFEPHAEQAVAVVPGAAIRMDAMIVDTRLIETEVVPVTQRAALVVVEQPPLTLEDNG